MTDRTMSRPRGDGNDFVLPRGYRAGAQLRFRTRIGFENSRTLAPHGAYCAHFDDLEGVRVRLFAPPRRAPEVFVVARTRARVRP